MSMDPAYTLLYSHIYLQNDTGLPCFSIPITDELINYVDYRGPDVIDVEDLPLIGNCSRLSFCDKKTKTCQPKRPVGSHCRHNMQCIVGDGGIPGHCSNKSICEVRHDLPAYYYDSTHQWKMGEEWPAATIALVVSGMIVLCIVVGRYVVPNLLKRIKTALEKWQNKSSSTETLMASSIDSEETWNENHKRWWKQVPGMKWVYSRLNRSSNGDSTHYYQLDNRTHEEPPPYREN